MKKYYLLLMNLILMQLAVHAQQLLQPNERILYSFETKNHKIMVLALDTANNTMVYRFGSKGDYETVISDELDDTIPVFVYHYYLRGGGSNNAGLDFNYVDFADENLFYRIFDEYSADDHATHIGLRITDLNISLDTEIEGILESRKGSLVDFRDNSLIPVIE